MNRRSYIVTLGVGISGLAGCTGSENHDGINPNADILDIFPQAPTDWNSEPPRLWYPFEIDVDEAAEANYTDQHGDVYVMRILKWSSEDEAAETDPLTEYVARAVVQNFEFVVYGEDDSQARVLLETSRYIEPNDIETVDPEDIDNGLEQDPEDT